MIFFDAPGIVQHTSTDIDKRERRLKRVDGMNSQRSRRTPTHSTAFVRLLTNHRDDSADADTGTDADADADAAAAVHAARETLATIKTNCREGRKTDKKRRNAMLRNICEIRNKMCNKRNNQK